MLDVQDIFRRVIDRGRYNNEFFEHSEYMCWALIHALMTDLITLDEFYDARRAIDEYIAELGALPGSAMVDALREADFVDPEYVHLDRHREWATEHGKDFYWNWDARPRP